MYLPFINLISIITPYLSSLWAIVITLIYLLHTHPLNVFLVYSYFFYLNFLKLNTTTYSLNYYYYYISITTITNIYLNHLFLLIYTSVIINCWLCFFFIIRLRFTHIILPFIRCFLLNHIFLESHCITNV